MSYTPNTVRKFRNGWIDSAADHMNEEMEVAERRKKDELSSGERLLARSTAK